jgi:excisionase family DNA binding protein
MTAQRRIDAAYGAPVIQPVLTGRGCTEDGRVAIAVEEAGRLLGIGRGSAYAAVKTGDIPSIRVGLRRVVVPVAALERILHMGVPESEGDPPMILTPDEGATS